MDTIFLNSEKRKTSDPHRLLFSISDKLNWKMSGKYVALSNLDIYYTWKNIKTTYKNISYNVEWVIWITDRSFFVSDIQYYFECIIKKHETMTDFPSLRIYGNKIENRITFKIKTGYYLV